MVPSLHEGKDLGEELLVLKCDLEGAIGELKEFEGVLFLLLGLIPEVYPYQVWDYFVLSPRHEV